MGKAAIVNPYLDTMGGGERYSLSFASVLAELGYQVEFEWKDVNIKSKLEDRFGIDLANVNFVEDVKKGDGYDLIFWISDGSVPLLRSRKNLIHFQIPFKKVDGRSLMNKMKLFRVNNIICNSNFTKSVIDSEYGVESLVIYPPVDTISLKQKKKENIILYVGRFSQLTQNKHQDILIKAFKKMNLESWKLVIAGGVEVGNDNYFEKLVGEVDGFNIELIKSPSFKELKELYGKAKIFWSASGFGIDEDSDPSKVEHFGITVVEAMTAGCVPIIYNAGGHREIVTEGEDGFLWNDTKELIDKTNDLIKNKKELRRLSDNAKERSNNFSYDKFRESIKKIL